MLLPLRPNELHIKRSYGKATKKVNTITLRSFSYWKDLLCISGVLFKIIKRRQDLTLSELLEDIQRSLDHDSRESFRRLGMLPKRGCTRKYILLLRPLQAFRIIDLDVKGLALRSDNIVITCRYPEWIPNADGGCIDQGISTLWALFLRDTMARRILLAVLKARPGQTYVDIDIRDLDLNIYDRLLLEELKFTVERWLSFNMLGSRRGKTTIINQLRPLNDISILLTFASIAGIIVPVHSYEKIAEEVTEELLNQETIRRSKYFKEFIRNIVHGRLLSYTQAIATLRSGEEVIDIVPWQKTAIDNVRGG